MIFNELTKFIRAEKGDAYPLPFIYGSISLLFFIGTYVYHKQDVYSDQMLL